MAMAVLAPLQRSSPLSFCLLTVSSQIPGDATLVFEIELFDFHGEDITKVLFSVPVTFAFIPVLTLQDKDMGVVKRTKTAGEGYDQPNDGSQVRESFKMPNKRHQT